MEYGFNNRFALNSASYDWLNEKKKDDDIDRDYEKNTMKNQLKYFNMQKADYERGIAKENKAQANLDNASKFVFGKKG